jgi:reversibly glycosylated polypeptide
VRVDLVMTSIGDGRFLAAYAPVLREPGTRLVVIPDENTPAELYARVDEARRAGAEILCPELAEQDSLLTALGAEPLVERRSDSRRNIGYLIAHRDGCDAVVSLDDDNLPTGETFLDDHLVVTREQVDSCVVSSSTGWFEPCSLLELPAHVHARGFPVHARRPGTTTRRSGKSRVAVNAGLWLGDPDVDAMTRLVCSPVATVTTTGRVVLDTETWAPVNSQNTAVARRALPAYYFPRVPGILGGRRVGRYADIVSGLFVQFCAKAMGDGIAFGVPVVQHARNEHDLFADADQELPLIRWLEDLTGWITGVRATSSSYPELYLELAALLEDECERWATPSWSPSLRAWCHELCYLMRTWIRTLDRLGSPVDVRLSASSRGER